MTLYKKDGRKYIAVKETEVFDGIPHGYWFVNVYKGGRQAQPVPDFDKAKFLSRISNLREELCTSLVKASECRPRSQPITEEQKKAWEDFTKAMGGEPWGMLEYPSIRDIVEEAILKLQVKLYIEE